MSYQVLARKWRPRNFKEMVGQEHVLRALINALDNNRLHHAFLFTGTRGVGKTTIARILAKSLNCETGVGASPCGTCSSCREIDEGRFIDLIEVDAASRTKVEDTRELLENVQYAPTRGRYKVYLIDEVHMLSTHSFNALLKTLEEPPPHVKFLLATTDPQKLPVTILSRCLQFNLRRLAPELIARHLAHILEREDIAHDASALALIAHAADGSMRDALSLLDQAIAYGGGAVREAEARDMLGSINRGQVHALLEALADQDGATLMNTAQALAEQAPDFSAVLGELLSTLQRIALAQCVPAAIQGADDEALITRLAGRFTPEDVQLHYQIGLHGRRDLPLAPSARTGFEMCLLRMLAFRPQEAAAVPQAVPVKPQARPAAPVAAPAPAASPAPAAAAPAAAAPVAAAPVAPAAPVAARPAAAPAMGDDWTEIVARINLTGMVQQLALHCTLKARDDEAITLLLAAPQGHLLNKQRQERLQEALQRHFGTRARLVIQTGQSEAENPAQRQERKQKERQHEAQQAIESDGTVKALQDTFGAVINPGTVRPRD